MLVDQHAYIIEKNERIRNKGHETRNKRKTQAAKSFVIKIDKSKISKEKTNHAGIHKYITPVKASIANEARSPKQAGVAQEVPYVKV